MDDRQALMAAIIANPDEDTPRLALADWLDEHGDEHDRARAEFIRLQCELALLPPVALQTEKHKRAEVLHQQHHKEWLGLLAPLSAADEFTRGLLDRWWCLVATFMEERYQRTLCEWLPRLGAKRLLLSKNTASVERVTTAPALEWFVEWCWIEAKLDDAGLGHLARTPCGSRVSRVLLTHLRCTDAGLAALAESSAFPNLRTLGLRAFADHGRYTHAGIVRILESQRFPKLDSLDLRDALPGEFQQAALYDNPMLSRLRVFDPPNACDVSALCHCKHLVRLEVLRIRDSTLTDTDMLTLLDNPTFAKLRTLELNRVNVGGSRLSPEVAKRLRDRFGMGLSVFESQLFDADPN